MAIKKLHPNFEEVCLKIHERALVVLGNGSNAYKQKLNFEAALQEVSKLDRGLYFVWLCITGCYPTKSEFRRFCSDVEISSLQVATERLIHLRLETYRTKIHMLQINLKLTNAKYLVDITHTLHAPFVTGIQRVVRQIVNEASASEVQPFQFLDNSGILLKASFSEALDTTHANHRTSWRFKLIQKLHQFAVSLEKRPFTNKIRSRLLPTGRFLKLQMLTMDEKNYFENLRKIGIDNIVIIGKKIVIPEIPNPNAIQIYESIMENNVVPTEMLLYDFIPIFHAWTVHLANRGNLNSYLRLVLLANRVVSISKVVQEQAILLTKAFSLERTSWAQRRREFSHLSLPSGIKPTTVENVNKEDDLIIMVGSLEPRKNHVQFFNALEILSQRGVIVNAKIFAATGWENEEILDRFYEVRSRGIALERLSVNDDELAFWISKAQILIQVSEAEGFGLPVAEAVSLGTKVIVSDIKPLNEFNSSLVTKVEIDNPVALADEITRVLSDSSTASQPQSLSVTWDDWRRELFSF